MALVWKRVHLSVFLIFLKYTVGYGGWVPQNVQTQQDWLVHKHFSPRGLQSSVLKAPATGSIPLEEVAPNVVPGKSSSNMLTASSPNSSGLQLSGSSSPLSTQSSSSTGTSGSYRRLFTSAYKGSSGPQQTGGFSQFVSTSGLLAQSPSTESQNIPGLLYAKLPASPLSFSQSTSGQSSYSQYTSSSQSRVGTRLPGSSPSVPVSTPTDGSSLQLQGTAAEVVLGAKVPVYSQAVPSGSSALSQTSQLKPSTSRWSQGFQASGTVASDSSFPFQGSKAPSRFSTLTSAANPSQFASTQKGTGRYSGLSIQSQSMSNQYNPGYAKLSASPLGVSQSTSGQSSYSQYTSSSQSRVDPQLKVPGQGSSYGLSVQPQGTPSQNAPALSLDAKLPMSSQYYQATWSGSLPPTWSSQEQQPSTSRTKGFQASSTAVLQGSGTSQSSSWSPSTFPSLSSAGGSISSTDSSSVQSQDASSQKAPVPLGAKVSVYRQAAPSGSSLSMSQPSRGFKALRKISSSAVSPGPFALTQEGSGRYSGLSSLSQSASLYSPGSPVYAKPGSSLLDFSSQSASGQSSYSQYTSSSQSRVGTHLLGSSPYVPVSTPTDGSSLQLQGSAALYASASLGAKVPVYSQAVPSGSSALSQTSQLKPSTSRWSQGFQASGTVASDSSFPFQGSKAPSRFSTLTSAANPSQFASTQKGTGRYSGLSIQSQSMSNQYNPGYAKLSASPLGVSQSTSGQSSYSQYTSSSQSKAGTHLAGSTYYAPVQTGSTSTDRSPLQLQGTSSLYAPLPQSAKVPVYSLAAPSRPSLSQSQPSKWQTSSSGSQGFQTSGTVALQSGSASQDSKALSRFPTLASAATTGQSASKQEGSGGYSGMSSLAQGTASQYSRGSHAYAKRGSSLSVSSQSTSDHSSSGLYVSNSQSLAGTQLADSNRYRPDQTGSVSTGATLKVQGTCEHHGPSVPCQCDGGPSSKVQGTCSHHAHSVPCQCANASPSGSSLTGSEAPQKWQPLASSWDQGFQASGTAIPQSNASPQSSKSSISSSRASSFFVGPAKLSAQAAVDSKIGSQISPGVSASVQYPSDSMTSSLGSSVQGGLQGMSGQSSDSAVISSSYGSTYGQKASDYSRPSQGFTKG